MSEAPLIVDDHAELADILRSVSKVKGPMQHQTHRMIREAYPLYLEQQKLGIFHGDFKQFLFDTFPLVYEDGSLTQLSRTVISNSLEAVMYTVFDSPEAKARDRREMLKLTMHVGYLVALMAFAYVLGIWENMRNFGNDHQLHTKSIEE